MPPYINSPFGKVVALQAGIPEYLYGTFNADVPNTRMLVSEVALNTNVATLTVQIVEGDIPAVGSYISVEGTQSGTGEFNVSRIALTGVSINASTGAGTVTFALTGTNLTTTADAGVAIVETPEVGETLANGSSIPCSPLFQDVHPQGQRSISVQITFPTLPTAATVYLQGSNENIDSQYVNIGSAVATVATGAYTPAANQIAPIAYRFYRLNVSGLSGTGTIVGKVVTG